jgi:Pyruvate/2-oxoacid:ferredoxin oxidoreductase gamma subunit
MKSRILKTLSLVAVLFLATETFAATQFNHAEYFKATSAGQKKSGSPVKGTLSFDASRKSVEFLTENNVAAFSIQYDAIKDLLYEQTSTPRYAEAVLISPFFLLAHSKKHYLTIQYTDEAGAGQYVIVRLDKKRARAAVAAAESETGKKVERVEEK